MSCPYNREIILDSLLGSLQAEFSPHWRYRGKSERFEAYLQRDGK